MPEDLVRRGVAPDVAGPICPMFIGSERKRRQAPPGLMVTGGRLGGGRKLPVAMKLDLL